MLIEEVYPLHIARLCYLLFKQHGMAFNGPYILVARFLFDYAELVRRHLRYAIPLIRKPPSMDHYHWHWSEQLINHVLLRIRDMPRGCILDVMSERIPTFELALWGNGDVRVMFTRTYADKRRAAVRVVDRRGAHIADRPLYL